MDQTERASPFQTRAAQEGAGRLGMRLFMVSLAMLFAAGVLAILVIRWGTDWPDDIPPLPRILWVSTAVLICSSIVLQWGVKGLRRGSMATLHRALWMTAALGVAFLVLQIIAWVQWNEAIATIWEVSNEHRLAVTGFQVLTGVHAAHLIGGLLPLGLVLYYVAGREYSLQHHPGLPYLVTYWHFLDAVWVVLMIIMMTGL